MDRTHLTVEPLRTVKYLALKPKKLALKAGLRLARRTKAGNEELGPRRLGDGDLGSGLLPSHGTGMAATSKP